MLLLNIYVVEQQYLNISYYNYDKMVDFDKIMDIALIGGIAFFGYQIYKKFFSEEKENVPSGITIPQMFESPSFRESYYKETMPYISFVDRNPINPNEYNINTGYGVTSGGVPYVSPTPLEKNPQVFMGVAGYVPEGHPSLKLPFNTDMSIFEKNGLDKYMSPILKRNLNNKNIENQYGFSQNPTQIFTQPQTKQMVSIAPKQTITSTFTAPKSMSLAANVSRGAKAIPNARGGYTYVF